MIKKTLAGVFALLCATCNAVHAQTAANFPLKSVRVVVPYPPGGGTDTIGRPMAQRLAENTRSYTDGLSFDHAVTQGQTRAGILHIG